MRQPAEDFVCAVHSLYIFFIDFQRNNISATDREWHTPVDIFRKKSFEGKVSLLILISASKFTFKEYNKPVAYEVDNYDADNPSDNQILIETFSVHQIQKNVQRYVKYQIHGTERYW